MHPPSRDRLREALWPRIPELSGNPRSPASRNVALIDIKWFVQFIKWMKLTGPVPGRIPNDAVKLLLCEKGVCREGFEFGVVEINVWEALEATFGGGPSVMRPFMQHPVTRIGQTVVSPIRFSISINGEQMLRTADPEWTIGDFKHSIAKKLNCAASQISLRVGESGLRQKMTLREVSAQFGQQLTMMKRESESADDRSLEPGDKASVSMSMKTIDLLNSGRQASYVMMMSLCLILSQRKTVRTIFDDPESTVEGTPAARFGELVREAITRPGTMKGMSPLYCAIAVERPGILTMFFEDFAALMHEFCLSIGAGLVDRGPWEKAFEMTVRHKMTCAKCGKLDEYMESTTCLRIDVPIKKLMNKSLEACIDGYKERDRENDDKWQCKACKKCHRPSRSAKIVEFGNIAIMALERTMNASHSSGKFVDVKYGHRLSLPRCDKHRASEYALTGVVLPSVGGGSTKLRSFAWSDASESWVVFGSSRAKVTTPNTVIVPNSAILLVYERHNI